MTEVQGWNSERWFKQAVAHYAAMTEDLGSVEIISAIECAKFCLEMSKQLREVELKNIGIVND